MRLTVAIAAVLIGAALGLGGYTFIYAKGYQEREGRRRAARATRRRARLPAAQFLLDFVEAENSTGFHAPQEAARILTMSVDASRRGEMVLRPLSVVTPSVSEGPGRAGGATLQLCRAGRPSA